MASPTIGVVGEHMLRMEVFIGVSWNSLSRRAGNKATIVCAS